MSFSIRLRALREKANYKQQEFAKKLNISKSTYNNYEKGIRTPGPEIITRIAELLDTTVDYLYGRTDSPNNVVYHASQTEASVLKEFGIDYIEGIKELQESGLTPEEFKELIELAKKLKK